MLRLILLRHAKSARPAGLADHDRPLSERGLVDARLMGRHIGAQDFGMQLAVVSDSRRTRQTYEIAAATGWPRQPALRLEPRIYETPSSVLLDEMRALPEGTDIVLVVGHNPGFEDLAGSLVGAGDAQLRRKLATKFPTGALAVLDFDLDRWAQIGPRKGRLTRFVIPRDLGGGPPGKG